MNPTLDRLKAGIQKFQIEVYGQNTDAYRDAVTHPQQPHTLMIACADSRVDPETLTSAGPGEIFIARNVGNMVPAFGETPGGIGAVIEYAVAALHVQHIVVCGHSDCGAMKALVTPSDVDALPYVARWLTHGRAALRVAESIHERTGRDLLTVLTEQNVLMQMAHLRTHPHVAGALARNQVTISGWIYDIGPGEVRICEDGASTEFVTLRPGDARL